MKYRSTKGSGTSFGLTELLAAKEERLEDKLWSTVTAMEELRALLQDLVDGPGGPYEARIARLENHAAWLRRLIEEIRPFQVETRDVPEPGKRTDDTSGAGPPRTQP